MSREAWQQQFDAAMERFAPPGVVRREVSGTITGLEYLEGLMAGKYPGIPIGLTANFCPIEVAKGRAVFMGVPSAAFYNPLATVHGGWITAILDSALGCSVHSTLDVGEAYTTVEVKVNFVRAVLASTGPVRAEGDVIHRGRSIATAEAKLIDSAGKLLAHGTTTCMIFPA